MKNYRAVFTISVFLAAALAAGCGGDNPREAADGTAAGMAHLERAHIIIERGDLDKAMEDLVVAARLMPDSAGPLMVIGDIHMAYRRFQEAVESYRAALAIDPSIARAHFNIGYISKEYRDDDATALARLSKAAELDSSNATFAFQLGDLHHKMERFAEAKECFEKAISLDSDHAYAHYSLGEIYDEHMDSPAVGFSEYEKAVSIAPMDANLRLLVGSAYAKRGRPEAAIRHLTDFLRLAPEAPEAPAVEEMVRRLDNSLGVSH